MKKHEWLVGILWAIAVLALYKSGTRDPVAMGYAGFVVAYGLCHIKAAGFRFLSVVCGLMGLLAGWATMGYLHMAGEGEATFMLIVGFGFYCIALLVSRGVKA